MTVIVLARASDGFVIAADGRRTRQGHEVRSDQVKIRHVGFGSTPVGDSGVLWATYGRGEIGGRSVHDIAEESNAPGNCNPGETVDGIISALRASVYQWNKAERCRCPHQCPDMYDCELADEAAGLLASDFYDPDRDPGWCRCRAWVEEPLGLLSLSYGPDRIADETRFHTLNRVGQIEVSTIADWSIFGSLGHDSLAVDRVAELNCKPLRTYDVTVREVEHLLSRSYFEADEEAKQRQAVATIGGRAKIAGVQVKRGRTVFSERFVTDVDRPAWYRWLGDETLSDWPTA